MIKIQKNVDLSKLNTLALSSQTSDFIEITDSKQIKFAVDYAKQQQLSIFVLSGGSNLLLPENFQALTLHMQNLGTEILEHTSEYVIVKAEAGEIWHHFVCDCTTKGFYGLENLALIPGYVGASPIQNIGAYGAEAGEFIQDIWAYDTQSDADVILNASECQFGYRDSIFKQQAGRYIIYAVSFKLSRKPQLKLNYADVAQRVGDQATPQKLLSTIVEIRKNKLPQPEQYPNAGSFFKNPILSNDAFQQFSAQYPNAPHYPQADGRVKVAAGWLIEQAGWKGKKLGVVGMFEKQALVLVNYGQATLEDVKNAYYHIQDDVFEKFAITLEPEPVLLNQHGHVQAHRRVL